MKPTNLTALALQMKLEQMQDQQIRQQQNASEALKKQLKSAVSSKYNIYQYTSPIKIMNDEVSEYLSIIGTRLSEIVYDKFPKIFTQEITKHSRSSLQEYLKPEIKNIYNLFTEQTGLINSYMAHKKVVSAYAERILACPNLQQADAIAEEISSIHKEWKLKMDNGIKNASEDMITKIDKFFQKSDPDMLDKNFKPSSVNANVNQNEEVKILKDKIKDLEQTIIEQKTTIASQAAKIEEQNTKIASEAIKTEDQSTKIASQAAKIEEQNAKIASQATKIEEQNAKIASQATKIEDQDIRVSKLESVVNSLSQKFTNFDIQFDPVENDNNVVNLGEDSSN